MNEIKNFEGFLKLKESGALEPKVDEGRKFVEDELKQLAKEGKAFKDGTFPIVDTSTLKDAIEEYESGDYPKKVKEHIVKRAKELGKRDELPGTWDEATKEAKKAERKKEEAEEAKEEKPKAKE